MPWCLVICGIEANCKRAPAEDRLVMPKGLDLCELPSIAILVSSLKQRRPKFSTLLSKWAEQLDCASSVAQLSMAGSASTSTIPNQECVSKGLASF